MFDVDVLSCLTVNFRFESVAEESSSAQKTLCCDFVYVFTHLRRQTVVILIPTADIQPYLTSTCLILLI